jgi:hypothetical protein
MTCQECELKLGTGEDAAEHLASCAECRWLAQELRLNSQAMREMKVRPRLHWEWALAAAAAIVMAIGLWRTKTPPKEPPERAAAAKIGRPTRPESSARAAVSPLPPRTHHAKRREPAEALRVKMLTSDPDVVIYWIVDKKEGYE